MIFLFIFSTLMLSAQDTTFEIRVVKPKIGLSGNVYKVVDQMPRFPGGDDSLMQFIQKNLVYSNCDVKGRVVVGFIVNEDGSLSDIKIRKSLSKATDEEALRVANLFPKFVPGMQMGKAVRVQNMLPILFRFSCN